MVIKKGYKKCKIGNKKIRKPKEVPSNKVRFY